MISVFLPVEDYCLNYESKVENSFVNAIPPQKKFVPPPTKSPRLLPLPSPSISPQGSQPISQPLPLAMLRKAPNLSPQRRGSPSHLTSIRAKRKLPYTLQHQSPRIPYRSRVHRLFPLTKELIHLLQQPKKQCVPQGYSLRHALLLWL